MAMSTPAGGPPPPFISGLFRAELARILPLWEADGHISHDEAQRLNRDYRLDDLYLTKAVAPKPSVDPATLALRVAFLIGGLLVGFGIIAFVAANWNAISDFGKAGILNATVLLLYLSGYYFWFKRNLPVLGHSLIFAGSLAFGADLGLMAQGVNVSLPHFAGYGYWAAGVLCIAILVRSIPILALSFVAGAIWLIGGCSDSSALANFERFMGTAVALIAAAHWMRLRWLNWMSGASAVVACLVFVGQATGQWEWLAFAALTLGAISAGASKLLSDPRETQIARSLAWLGALATVLLASIARVAIATQTDWSGHAVRHMTAIQQEGVGFALALVLIAACLGGFVARSGVKSWPSAIAVIFSGLAAAAGILGPALGIDLASSATLCLMSGFALSAELFAAYATTRRQDAIPVGLLGLVAFALTLLGYSAEIGGPAIAVIALMGFAAFAAALGGAISTRCGDSAASLAGRGAAWLTVGITALAAAFHDMWDIDRSAAKSGLLLQVWICVGVLYLAAALLALRRRSATQSWPESGMVVAGAMLAVAGGVSLAGFHYAFPTALSIAASLGVGACLVGAGLSQERRPLYWLGSTYLVAIVVMRFFEYETTPLEKSIAFILGGTLILVLGAYFERRSRNRGMRHAH